MQNLEANPSPLDLEEADTKPLSEDQRTWYHLAAPVSDAAVAPAPAASPATPVLRATSQFETHHPTHPGTRKLHKISPTSEPSTFPETSLSAPESKQSKRRSVKLHKSPSAKVVPAEQDYIYHYFGGNTLSVRVENSTYSKEIKLGASNNGSFSIKDSVTNRRYMFSLSVAAAPAKVRILSIPVEFGIVV